MKLIETLADQTDENTLWEKTLTLLSLTLSQIASNNENGSVDTKPVLKLLTSPFSIFLFTFSKLYSLLNHSRRNSARLFIQPLLYMQEVQNGRQRRYVYKAT